MPLSYAAYEHKDGYIQNWLVTRPEFIKVDTTQGSQNIDSREEIARQQFQPKLEVKKQPVEQGPITEGIFKNGDFESAWSYVGCEEDHYVHRSTFCQGLHFVRAWAYTQLFTKDIHEVSAVVSTFGPVDVWINKQHAFHSESFSDHYPQSQQFSLKLLKGKNDIIVRFANATSGACPLIMSLQIDPAVSNIAVRIPSLAKSINRRNELEQAHKMALAERDVYGAQQRMAMNWPEDMPSSSFTTVRLQTRDGRIYGETEADGKPGEMVNPINASNLPDGPFQFFLMPRPWELYESYIRMTRPINVWVVSGTHHSEVPYGNLTTRQHECINYAASKNDSLYGEIARMALGKWDEINLKPILASIEKVQNQTADSVVDLASLMGMRFRFEENGSFPEALVEPLEKAILSYRYFSEQPGDDGMDFQSESRQILFHTCAILAGQLYMDQTFANDQTGQQIQAQAEQMALQWMHKRGTTGFADWDSPSAYAENLLALSLLVELADSEPIWELASILMDKIFFTIALNSFKGTFATAHRRADAWTVRSGLVEETTGITRLMWGMGVFNHHLAAPLNLSMLEKYELPPIIAQIAISPESSWNRESHAASEEQVNKTAYRTKDYLLSSVQDFRAGEMGDCELVWQACLGPNALVFTNHPAYSVDQEHLQPGFWSGNRSLPRVAQWEDVLIAIYQLQANDRMGFTHAYFPTTNFDEYVLRDGWAFARTAEGYLALTASNEISMVRHGSTAMRELRAYGQETIWLCQMGSTLEDGTFEAFQQKVLNLPVTFDGLNVSLTSLRDEQLSFGWGAPFTRGGEAQTLTGFPHYDNRYCSAPLPCEAMEIRTEDYLLKLNFDISLPGPDSEQQNEG
jgi:hypothetical protein